MNSNELAMRSALLVLIGLVVISITIISVYLTPDDLKGCSEVTQAGKCQAADAIVAVSGGDTSARVAEAIRLYKSGWSDTLIFSGAAADTSGPSNAEVMRSQAVKAGVPAQSIKIETLSQTTRQNAEHVKELIIEASSGSSQRVILVTSPYHQRRASLEFQELAGSSTTIVNRPTTSDSDWSVVWWLTPRGWWLAGGELAKIIAFYAGESK